MHRFAAAVMLCGLPASTFAQTMPLVATPVAIGTMLPTNTEVAVTLNDEVNSKRLRVGDTFAVAVARDVMAGDYVVIPRGTQGQGQVTWRTGKGAFGKSGKMEIEVRSLLLNGRTVPLSGKFREEGQGNTGAVIGTMVGAGLVWGALVTGRSAVFARGRELKAFTVEALPIVRGGMASAMVPAVAAAAPVVAVARPAVATSLASAVVPLAAVAAPVPVRYVRPLPAPVRVAPLPARAGGPGWTISD